MVVIGRVQQSGGGGTSVRLECVDATRLRCISRLHARVLRVRVPGVYGDEEAGELTQWFLYDESNTGTYVNQVRVVKHRHVRLEDGDEVMFGGVLTGARALPEEGHKVQFETAWRYEFSVGDDERRAREEVKARRRVRVQEEEDEEEEDEEEEEEGSEATAKLSLSSGGEGEEVAAVRRSRGGRPRRRFPTHPGGRVTSSQSTVVLSKGSAGLVAELPATQVGSELPSTDSGESDATSARPSLATKSSSDVSKRSEVSLGYATFGSREPQTQNRVLKQHPSKRKRAIGSSVSSSSDGDEAVLDEAEERARQRRLRRQQKRKQRAGSSGVKRRKVQAKREQRLARLASMSKKERKQEASEDDDLPVATYNGDSAGTPGQPDYGDSDSDEEAGVVPSVAEQESVQDEDGDVEMGDAEEVGNVDEVEEVPCPFCQKAFAVDAIEAHAGRCLDDKQRRDDERIARELAEKVD